MSEPLPAPPIAREVDLRDFPFMPLEVQRLRDSDLAHFTDGAAFKAAVLLWCAAWHQVPAGSLPDDDRWLARHSGAGARWKRVKAEALRGFTRCSDGRLYHAVVVEKAAAAWAKKEAQALRTLKARLKLAENKLRDAVSAGEREHLEAQINQLKASLSQAIRKSVTEPVTEPVTDSNRDGDGKGDREGDREGEGPAADSADEQRSAPPAPLALVDHALKVFNQAAVLKKWPIAEATPERAKKIAALIARAGGIEKWSAVVDRAASSHFFGNVRELTLDWFIEPGNFTKVAEGNYDRPHNPGNGQPTRHTNAQRAAALLNGIDKLARGEPPATRFPWDPPAEAPDPADLEPIGEASLADEGATHDDA